MRFSFQLLLLVLACGVPCLADAPRRWVPERCLELSAGEFDPAPARATPEPDSRWNEFYRGGIEAVERGAYADAEAGMCRALLVAREFGPRDWRFAETLDELGLIAYSVRDFELAERMQGAAIAEMLLAVGPHGEPFRDVGPSEQAPIRRDCRSGVHVYTTRLGWIDEQAPTRIAPSELERAPWRVFAAGYLPLDADLAKRLDWLISRYLLEENLVAADELSELRQRILGGER